MISDIFVFLFVLIFVFTGYKSGLIKTLFGLFSYIFSLLIAFMFYPIVSKIIKASELNDYIYNFAQDKINININEFSNIAAGSLSDFLINVISFITVIILSKIVISIISKALSFISKLPVISFFNRAGGAVLGGIKGIVLLYILFLFLTFLPNNTENKIISDINNSQFAKKLYNENLIIDILGKDVPDANS